MTDDMIIKEVSPKGSFKGYSFWVALKRNKEAVKQYIAIIGAINIIPPFNWKTFLVTLAAGTIALVVKMISDAIDYVTGEQEIKK